MQALVLARAPALLATPAQGAAPFPTVLWFHGFRADALAHAAELEQCAALGMIAVGIDAIDHGARANPELAARLARSPDGAMPVMLDLADRTIAEVPAIVDTLVREYDADRSRVAFVGISMGAFLVYRAITAGIPMRAAVALLGAPSSGASAPDIIASHYRHVALLSITAEHDASVPPVATRALHRQLSESAIPNARAHRHHELRGAGHLTNAAQWDEAMRETRAWLIQHG